MTLELGARLGSYEIRSAIGAGGMGEVYRAHDSGLGRDVAIKVLPTHFADDPERLARFEREARMLAALSHSNIAAIYGLERAGSQSVLVMELAEGETLAARIARGRLPIDDAIAIALQLAAALEAAHEKGIVHRDLKPANIVVSADGRVKVLDFGLAKLTENPAGGMRQSDLSMSPTIAQGTIAGVILGTAAYMSPEQARGKAVDKRADIWAFGCVLFEMLTGMQAFGGDTLTDVVAAVVKNEPDWTAVPAETPAAIRSVLRRCLKKDPAARVHDIADARIEIDDSTAPEPPLAPARSAPRWQQALPWAIACASLAISAVVALRTTVTSRNIPGPLARLELSPPPGVELFSGGGQTIALSPDGQRLAFIGIRGGVRQIYLRRLDQFDAVPVRGTEAAFACFFSPSSDSIGFVGTNGSLRRVSMADGLVTITAPSGADNAGSQAWGPDDRITFSRGAALWQVPAGGGTPKAITTLDVANGELAHSFPTVVDRSTILFTSLSARRPSRIEAVTPENGARRVVVESATFPMYTSQGQLIYLRDDALFAVGFDASRVTVTGVPIRVMEQVGIGPGGGPLAALSQSGSFVYRMGETAASTLVWVSRAGEQKPVSNTRRLYAGPRLSPDGRRVVVQASGDLWIHDLERATFTRLTSQATFGNSFPIWTPNGQRVIFRTSVGLHWIDVDRGATPQRIPDTSNGDFPTSVSPDGETLLIVRQTTGTSQDVYTTSLTGHGRPRPLISTPAFEGGAMFSADGRWITYVSDESGQMQVYVRHSTGERRWQVSTEGGTSPVWNRNGRELFYRNGNKIMAVAVAAGTDDLTLSQPRLLFEQAHTFGPTITIANYDVSADGQRFLFVKDEPDASRLAIVLNWLDDLKRLATTATK